jgi:16S rRNA processing protein RimM
VGRISRAHGVKGEVVVHALSQVQSRFDPGSRLLVGEGKEQELTVTEARPHGGRLLVRFEGIHDREAADALRGEFLFVPATSAPNLDEGEYWTHELVGCDVVTEEGRALGRIREIIHTQANDVWVTDGGEEEILIPALKDVVADVDIPGRRVVVRAVSGLTAP